MAIWLGDYGAHEIHRRDMDSVVVEVREVVGESLVYFAFDIDAIGPSCSPGTGVSEIRGGKRVMRG